MCCVRVERAGEGLMFEVFEKKSDGDRKNKPCKCKKCGNIRDCTPNYDFYSDPKDPEGWLYCRTCTADGIFPRGDPDRYTNFEKYPDLKEANGAV